MSNPSKRKGTDAESAVRTAAEAAGLPAVRVALAGSGEQGDVWVFPEGNGAKVCIEVKAGEQAANPSWGQIDRWFREAEAEAARTPNCDVAVLVIRRKGSGMAGDWFAWLRYSDLNYWLTPKALYSTVNSYTTGQRICMPLGDLLHLLKVGYHRHHNEGISHV